MSALVISHKHNLGKTIKVILLMFEFILGGKGQICFSTFCSLSLNLWFFLIVNGFVTNVFKKNRCSQQMRLSDEHLRFCWTSYTENWKMLLKCKIRGDCASMMRALGMWVLERFAVSSKPFVAKMS